MGVHAHAVAVNGDEHRLAAPAELHVGSWPPHSSELSHRVRCCSITAAAEVLLDWPLTAQPWCRTITPAARKALLICARGGQPCPTGEAFSCCCCAGCQEPQAHKPGPSCRCRESLQKTTRELKGRWSMGRQSLSPGSPRDSGAENSSSNTAGPAR